MKNLGNIYRIIMLLPSTIAHGTHLKGSHGSRSQSLYYTKYSPHACSSIKFPDYDRTGRIQHFILRRNKAAVYLQQLAHVISLSFSMLLRNKIRLQYVAHHQHNSCEGILTTLRDGTGLVRSSQVRTGTYCSDKSHQACTNTLLTPK